MRFYYCDHHAIPLPAGHKFPMEKYALVRERLSQDSRFTFERADAAAREAIETVHEAGYVRQILGGDVPAAVMRRIGFPWSDGLVRRTLASVGGTLAATADALRCGWGGNLAGGTHHAFRDAGAGFCVFNDIAIAVITFRAAGRFERAAILDLDVHQGDGTAAIFRDDPATFTVSLHGRNNFPFRKQRSSIDIDLADGTGDVEFLAALESVLPAIRTFRPEILFYQSGVDALAGDRLGRLALTHAGLNLRDRMVFQFCDDLNLPVVVTLGGGYCAEIRRTAEAHANTFLTAQEIFSASRAAL